MNKPFQLITVVVLILVTGCVAGRRTIDLPVRSLSDSIEKKGQIFIGKIEDRRIFQNDPPDAFIPSIDGDVNTLTPKQKAMMIGRQRGGFGNAMGDVALPADDSVIKRTRRLLEEGFKTRGYTITSDSSATSSASAKIEQFWGWFTPGFGVVSFEARVDCTIKLKRSDESSTIAVQGYGSNKGQIASDANWQLAYDRAFTNFLSNLDSELTAAGY